MYSVIRKIGKEWKFMGTPYETINDKIIDFHFKQDELLIDTNEKFDPIEDEAGNHVDRITVQENIVKTAFKLYINQKFDKKINDIFNCFNSQAEKEIFINDYNSIKLGIKKDDERNIIEFGDKLFNSVNELLIKKQKVIDEINTKNVNSLMIENLKNIL